MARHETSAGVVPFLIPAQPAAPRKYLLLNYGRHWDFPKGHIEKGEELLQTALRELEEETGIIDARIIPDFAREIEYFFRGRDKSLIQKTVWFCLAETQTTKVRLSHEHVGYEFLNFEQAMKRVTYAGPKQILQLAEAFLNELKVTG